MDSVFSIFLMILHIFSCAVLFLKCLTMERCRFPLSGLCFMQTGKKENKKLSGLIFTVHGCLLFL